MTSRRFPYGYTMINGKIEVCNDEAKVIRWIFQMRMDGDSCYAIAKMLYDLEIVYFSDSVKKAACKVSKILYDVRYIGDTQYPSIVDRNIFHRIQGMKGKAYCKKTASFSNEKSSHTAVFDYIPSDEIIKREQVLMHDNEVNKAAIFALAAEKYNCIIERSTP